MNRFIYRPIQRAPRESFFTLFVASFGMLIVVMNLVSILFGSGPRNLPTLSAPVTIGFFQISSAALIGLLVAVVFLILLRLFLENTETGIGLRAMADNVQLVEMLGLDRRRYATAAFVIGSVLVVPAAILTTYVQGLSPNTGLRIVIIALIVSIAGGVGSLPGAFVGALILGIVENVGTLAMSSTWAQALGFSVLLAILVFRPTGIIPKASGH